MTEKQAWILLQGAVYQVGGPAHKEALAFIRSKLNKVRRKKAQRRFIADTSGDDIVPKKSRGEHSHPDFFSS